ncbi:MAG TPA: tetratricopeptide repeat protein [Nitrospira sp.]|nr:tetratricopeptide repeat protein [Nitrospira sp.]
MMSPQLHRRMLGVTINRLLPLISLLMLYTVVSSCTSPPQPSSQPLATGPVASELLKRAQGGDPKAQNQLGLHYSEGRELPQNYQEAKYWFKRAADQGHAGAQVNLGTLYALGQGAPFSDPMALFWFQKAADQRNALAFAKLGMMYERGRGVSQNFVEAHMWYNLSAAYGEKRAAESRNAVAKHMTAEQVAEAEARAKKWAPNRR